MGNLRGKSSGKSRVSSTSEGVAPKSMQFGNFRFLRKLSVENFEEDEKQFLFVTNTNYEFSICRKVIF